MGTARQCGLIWPNGSAKSSIRRSSGALTCISYRCLCTANHSRSLLAARSDKKSKSSSGIGIQIRQRYLFRKSRYERSGLHYMPNKNNPEGVAQAWLMTGVPEEGSPLCACGAEFPMRMRAGTEPTPYRSHDCKKYFSRKSLLQKSLCRQIWKSRLYMQMYIEFLFEMICPIKCRRGNFARSLEVPTSGRQGICGFNCDRGSVRSERTRPAQSALSGPVKSIGASLLIGTEGAAIAVPPAGLSVCVFLYLVSDA